MKRSLKYPIILLVIFIVFLTVKYFIPNKVTEISNQDNIKNEIKFDSTSIKVNNKASVLMNLDTNQVIYQNNMNEALPVYSVSKVMFLASVAKKMEEDKIPYTKKINVTKLIDKVNTQGNFSSAGLSSKEVYTISELFDAVMIPSGNDAAILLAYAIFGNHSNAVIQMNKDAKEWKMEHSSFVSTSGLDGKYLNKIGIKTENGKNLMSSYDSILLVKRVMKDYPEIIEAGKKTTSVIGKYNSNKILLENVNEILEGLDYSYQDVYGLKTGSNIEKYSNCIIALKKNEHDQDILSISFSSKTRQTLYSDIASLYDYLNILELSNIQDDFYLNTKAGFVKNEVEFNLEKPYYLYHEKGQQFEYELKEISNKYNRSLNRFYGLDKGETIGELSINNQAEFFDGTPIGLSPVIVKNEPENKGIIGAIGEFIVDLIRK